MKEEALDRYPLTVNILSINRDSKEMATSSLTSFKKLFLNIARILGYNTDDSLYGVINNIINQNVRIFIHIGFENKNIASFLKEHQDQQLMNLGVGKELKVMFFSMSSPESRLKQLEDFKEVFINNDYPTDDIDQLIVSVREYIRKMEIEKTKTEQRENQFKPARERYVQGLQSPKDDEIRINVQINTANGWAFGKIPINISPDMKLKDVENIVKDALLNKIDLPNATSRFIYAGRIYSGNYKIGDIPQIKSGSNITMTY